MIQGVQYRRVRRLRLTVAAQEDLWRTQILLEDAFRTASLPGIPAGRLVVVKRLFLEQISCRLSSASLSRIIDRKFLELALQAVPADHPSATSSAVVYFRDEVEPFVRLAVRIAADQETSQWFWPIAAKGWRVTMSKSEGLRTMLFQVVKSHAGPAGVVALVAELHRLRLLEPLLANLRSADASYLMQLCGWAEPVARSISEPARENSYIPHAAKVVLTEWVNRWSAADVRSIWLAAVFLVEQKPVRLLDPQLIQRSIDLIEILGEESSTAALLAAKVNPILRKDVLDTPHQSPKHIAEIVADVAAEATESKAVAENSTPRLETASAKDVTEPGPFTSQANTLETPRFLAEGIRNVHSIRERSNTPERLEVSSSAQPETITETFAPTIAAKTGKVVELTPATLKLTWSDGSQLTEFGGFYFLLALISRFRIENFLERHPRFIEFDFPKRLLRFAAEQLQIPENDPVLTAILDVEDFECSELELTRALLTWYRALAHWIRRFGRIELSELVQRRALLSVSRTHLDLFFDLSSVDIRIRRAGLDLDPGWLPWFGRVVSFHYLEKDEIDGCK